jgi:hypothetical protein
VCAARVRRGGAAPGNADLRAADDDAGRPLPRLQLAVRHPNGEIGRTAWIFAETFFTGLATSSAGGVGFLEQTIPNASGL